MEDVRQSVDAEAPCQNAEGAGGTPQAVQFLKGGRARGRRGAAEAPCRSRSAYRRSSLPVHSLLGSNNISLSHSLTLKFVELWSTKLALDQIHPDGKSYELMTGY